MRNKALSRRLVAIEVKSRATANAIERENGFAAKRNISAKEAERAYRRLMAPAPPSEGPCRLSLDQVMAQYFRMVRGPAPSQGKPR